MGKVIIIGASSGLGKELTMLFSSKGYELGIVARRSDLLNKVAADASGIITTAVIDVSNTNEAIQSFNHFIYTIGDVDIIISSGIGHINPTLDWKLEKETIDTNVSGFAAMAGVAMRYFMKRGSGHLVGISSIASIRGDDTCPSYNASKAFVSNYLEGFRKKAAKSKLPITITDIQPGFVDTAMAKGDGLFWVASPQMAAKQIYEAIKSKNKIAYITKRWRIIAWLLKIIPNSIYDKI